MAVESVVNLTNSDQSALSGSHAVTSQKNLAYTIKAVAQIWGLPFESGSDLEVSV